MVKVSIDVVLNQLLNPYPCVSQLPGPGYYNTNYPGMPYPQSPSGAYPYYPPMPMAQPGHSIIIQPGVNGQPPTVTQVPINQMPMSA